MDKQELRMILDSYGADAKRWPAKERNEAQQSLLRNPALLKDARELDALLDSYVPQAPAPDFMEQILAQAATPKPAVIFYFARRWPMTIAATWAACAVIGFFAGTLNTNQVASVQMASVQTQSAQSTNKTTNDTSSLDHIIFGATQLNEVGYE